MLGLESFAAEFGVPIWLLVILLVWTLVWKALALWKSARKNHLIWFVAFFIIHTMGILEILYLFLFSKINLENNKTRKKRKK